MRLKCGITFIDLKMKIAYIGVPISLGADREGVGNAPDFFRQNGVLSLLKNLAGCYDLGNVNTSIIAESKYEAHPKAKFLESVVDVVSQLRDKVVSVIRQGYFPLVVGGDHSLGLGSTAGAALALDNVGVVWFDAHGDFNTEKTSPSGNLHGMPCAALMGLCESSFNNVAIKRIPSQNIFWIGARDLDKGELQLMKHLGLNVYSSALIREKGMNAVMESVFEKMEIQGVNNVHVSIDIDGMDPSIVCGTGTRVPNGMTNGDFYTFLDRLFETKNVRSADFVEYIPLLDDQDLTTAKWCTEALHYLAIKINGVEMLK